ncbi:MAG: response regulator [Acidobacteria bacterium]|nr:response regulator [Acidobacteriota bacterium]
MSTILTDQALAAVAETLPEPAAVIDGSGRILAANRGARDMFDVPRDASLPLDVGAFVPDDRRERYAQLRELFLAMPQSGAGRASMQGRTAVGRAIVVGVSGTRIETESGPRVLLLLHDAGQRTRPEELVRRLVEDLAAVTGAEFFARLVQLLAEQLAMDVVFIGERLPDRSSTVRMIAACIDGAPAAVHDYDLDGTPSAVVMANGACAYASDVRAAFPADLWLDEMRIESYCGLPLTTTRSETIGVLVAMARRPIGAIASIESTMRICAIRATAELERLRAAEVLRVSEQRGQQAQKLEAVGTLAGGIAHDFNNLLTVILGNAQLIDEALGPRHPQAAQVADILHAGRSAATLTKRLLAFSRRQRISPQVVDLNQLIAGIERLLQRVVREDIALDFALAPATPAVVVDPGQMEQVLVNLAINARDAMPGGGTLRVETVPADGGDGALLRVIDSGVGMDEATRSRIFEPFFTTKAPGHGTGLGLSTVYGIVSQAGGRVVVASEPGRGSVFEIFLPSARQPLPAPAPAIGLSRPVGGTETLLLAEDADQVRRFAADVLVRAGYTVIEAVNGEDALVRASRIEGPLHLLISDIVMPLIDGLELSKRLVAERPGLRVLHCSGYVASARQARLASAAFLPKPFTADDLLRAVRDVLDATA